MLKVSVTSNLNEVKARYSDASSRVVAPAAARALNRTAVTVRREVSSKIRLTYALPAADVKEQIRIMPATKARLEVRIVASGKRIPLYSFSAKQLKIRRGGKGGQVTVKVLRAGGRKVVTGRKGLTGRPFIATMKSGHTGVFQRVGKGRLKIKELFSIDVPSAMVSQRLSKALRGVATSRFAIEFNRELKFRLSKDQ